MYVMMSRQTMMAVAVLLGIFYGTVASSDGLQLDLFRAAHGARLPRSAEQRPQARVVGGSIVTDRCQAPFSSMVALQLYSENPLMKLTHCSGVMLSTDTIVTAAFCLIPYFTIPKEKLNIILGDKNFDFEDRFETIAKVLDFKVHPDFDENTNENNLAIIKLTQPATLNECVQPLPLYQPDSGVCRSALMNCTVTGWGSYVYYGNNPVNSKNALYGHVQVADEALTDLVTSSPSPAYTAKPNTLVGVAYPGWNVRACSYDQGGMAACQVGGRWSLRGIISDYNCDPTAPDAPVRLTNLRNFRSWISACLADFSSTSCQAYVP